MDRLIVWAWGAALIALATWGAVGAKLALMPVAGVFRAAGF